MDQASATPGGHASPESTASKLQVYTIGHAAENLALNSFDLEITPDEHMPMVDGEVSTNASQVQTTGTDLSGASYQVSAASSGTIKATWLPLGQPNRMTAPNVRRGEQVVVYRFGDNDKYYWNTMRNDLAFRRLETVVFAISATSVEGATADHSATYYVEFSAHKKSITLSTSKAQGEPFAYMVTIDTGNGKLTISDDVDNTMFLDSTQNQWHIQNGDGSFFDMTHKAISSYAADSIDFKTKAFSIESTTATLQAQTNTITATTTHNGNFTENGMYELNGDMTTAEGTEGGNGSIKMAGDMTLEGNQTVQGNLSVKGVISSPNQVQAPDPD